MSGRHTLAYSLHGLLVKPEVAQRQVEAEKTPPPVVVPTPAPSLGAGGRAGPSGATTPPPAATSTPPPRKLKRYHGSVTLNATRAGRDAGAIAEEVISHLAGLSGAKVTVTLEIEAEVPAGVPDNVIRTVTENGRTLKFTSQGFEEE